MAELDNSITATQMRHYVATIYAALEIPDEERKQFYEHMGHSEAVNKNVYQSPLAVKEVIKVGGFLDRLDKGQLSETVARSSSSEGSTNDTRFTEMTPLNNNGCNGYDQQNVMSSDSCGICQTYHVGAEHLSEGISTVLIQEGNTNAGHNHVSSPDSEVHTLESMNAISLSTRDKLAAKLNKNQIQKERSVILPGSSRRKTTTPKIVFLNSSRDPGPQDMDYSDSGSSCQSSPTKKRIYRSWNTEHTKTIQLCFERYIRDTSDIKGNTGPLPSADEVKAFIKQHPEILPDVSPTAKISRIKTKVFNERKEVRRKMAAIEGNLEKKTILKGKEEINFH